MKSKIKAILAIMSMLLVFTPALATAQSGLVQCGRPINYPNGATVEQRAKLDQDNACTIKNLFVEVRTIINFLLSWAWLVTIIFIVWSGWNMITAGGNEEGLTKAKTSLSNAIIGFFLILAMFVLLNFVISILTGNSVPRAGSLDEVFRLVP